MRQTTRIAILGLYSSGSTAVAGILHHLGVEMGSPFCYNYYESAWLARQLRIWWNEPFLQEMIPKKVRIQILTNWIQEQELRGNSQWVGMKHPLLSLCADDIVEAWGKDIRFIWSCRPLENSINSLDSRDWWTNGEIVQGTLWSALTRFFKQQPHLRIEFSQMMTHPEKEIGRIIEYVGMTPSKEQVKSALRFIQPKSWE
jgi:hypothetical protein